MIALDCPFLLFFLFGQPLPAWIKVLSIAPLLCVVVHLLGEGCRWQMVPAYFVSAAIGSYYLVVVQEPMVVGHATGLLGIGLLGASVVCGSILPVFSLPDPDGKYPIGTSRSKWIDSNPRRELGPRILNLQFWYPAQKNRGRRASYRNQETRSAKSAQLELVKTHAVLNALVTDSLDSIPLILFSPAWNGKGNQNTIQFEMLASHGFAVVAVDHPVSPDIPADFDISSEDKFPKYSIEVKRRAEDVSFVIDQLDKLDPNDLNKVLVSRFDLSRIGVFGHSFGGAVAAAACWMDRRLKAGINMDGLMFGDAAEAGIEQPFFFMSDDTPKPTTEELHHLDHKERMRALAIDTDMKRVQASLARYGGYYLSVDGMAHNNYSDRILYSPVRRLTGAGSINSKKSIEIVNRYTLAFFEQSLKGRTQALLGQAPSKYSEAHFEQHGRPVFPEKQPPGVLAETTSGVRNV